jgi:hypothetical protein
MPLSFAFFSRLPPSLRAPFEFDDEVVVAVVFLRGDVAVAATADVEGAVLGKGPDVLRIIVEVGLRIDVVLDRAGFDDFEEVDLRLSPAQRRTLGMRRKRARGQVRGGAWKGYGEGTQIITARNPRRKTRIGAKNGAFVMAAGLFAGNAP